MGLARAQSTPLFDLAATYPFVSSKAVAAVDANGLTPALAFVGFGGGVVALDVSAPGQPKVWTGTGPESLGYLRTGDADRGGFAFDLDTNATDLFVAAGTAGLVRFNRTSWARTQTTLSLTETVEARAVAAVDTPSGPRVVVVANTHASESTVAAAVILVDPATNTALHSLPLAKPVTTVAAYDPGAGNDVCVLVGTACDGVHRFSIQSQGTGTHNTLVVAGTWSTGSTNKAYVRDIAIDPVRHLAYVATYGAYKFTDPPTIPPTTMQVANVKRGVHALLIETNGALTRLTTGGWPVDPVQAGIAHYCYSVAYDPTWDRLVIGTGPKLAAETQYSRDCTHAVPCDCDDGSAGCGDEAGCDVVAGRQGIHVYRVSGQGLATTVQFEDEQHEDSVPDLEASCIALAIRPTASEAEYFVHIAGDAKGYRLAHHIPGPIPFTNPGTFDEENEPVQGDPVPLHSMDGALLRDDGVDTKVLYVASELGVATFDLKQPGPSPRPDKLLPTNPLEPPTSTTLALLDDFDEPVQLPPITNYKPGALTLAYAGPTDARLYASDTSRVRIFNVDGANEASPESVLQCITPFDVAAEPYAKTFHLATAPGMAMLEPPAAPLGRWLYVSLLNLKPDEPAGSDPFSTGGIALVDVGTAGTSATDPLTSVTLLDEYRHTGGTPFARSVKFGGIAVVPISNQEQVVYVAYGPTAGSSAYNEKGAGIMVLRTLWEQIVEPGGAVHWAPRIQFHAKVPADPDPSWVACEGALPGLVTYDPGIAGVPGHHKRLLVGLGCGGMALYSLTGGYLSPNVEFYKAGQSVFNVVRGPTSAGGQPYFYTSYLNEGIGVFIASPPTVGFLDYFPTGFQLVQLVLASSDRRDIFVTDARGGVSRYHFNLQ